MLHYGRGRTRANEKTPDEGNRRLLAYCGNAESFAESENKDGRRPRYLKATNYPARLLFKARIASNVLNQGSRWRRDMEFRRS